ALGVDLVGGGGGDRGDQVRRGLDHAVDGDGLAGLHRSTRDEDDRDVQPHRGVQHARGDLVAVRDAHQRVGGVPVNHVLHAVGDDLAGGQGVENASVALP